MFIEEPAVTRQYRLISLAWLDTTSSITLKIHKKQWTLSVALNGTNTKQTITYSSIKTTTLIVASKTNNHP